MTQWHDTMVDRPDTNQAAYVTGWTISGLAVLGTIVLGFSPLEPWKSKERGMIAREALVRHRA